MNNKGTVWTVDDDRFITLAIRTNLEIEGYEVVEFSHPLELLGQFELVGFDLPDVQLPDLIITEFRMYNQPISTDYIDMIRMIRADENWNNIPIIVMSRFSADVDVEAATVIGCDCFLTKPFEPEELLLTVQKLLALPD